MLIDGYSLRARVAPVFLTIFPFLMVFNLWFSEQWSFKLGIGSTIFFIAFSMLGSHLGRHLGKRKEKKLWNFWDGPPTTRFLRHSNMEFNKIRRNHCHKKLQELLPDIELPTDKQESINLSLADQKYETCVRFLISSTRDKKRYPLIYKENVNYGFMRNLWGLKPFGVMVSIISLILSLLFIILKWPLQVETYHFPIITILFSISSFLLWIFWIKPSSVKIVADAYAERLLEYCEQCEKS
jgi:hypothetical protein